MKSDNKKIRKRRREARLKSEEHREDDATDDASAEQQDHRSDDEHRSTTAKKQKLQPLPLTGKILAVSTLMEGSSTVERKDSRNKESSTITESYANVTALCRQAGATVSSQVHKSVFAVVATKSAVEGETQRVRKAWRKNISVLRVEWVQECRRTNKFQPLQDYLILPKPTGGASQKSQEYQKKSLVEKNDESKEETSIEVKIYEGSLSETVELGCCCVCHDTDKTDCPWCADCSVRREAKTTTKAGDSKGRKRDRNK